MYDTSVKVGNPSKDGTESCPATTGMAIYTWGAQGVVAQRFLTVANGPGPVPVTIPDMNLVKTYMWTPVPALREVSVGL